MLRKLAQVILANMQKQNVSNQHVLPSFQHRKLTTLKITTTMWVTKNPKKVLGKLLHRLGRMLWANVFAAVLMKTFLTRAHKNKRRLTRNHFSNWAEVSNPKGLQPHLKLGLKLHPKQSLERQVQLAAEGARFRAVTEEWLKSKITKTNTMLLVLSLKTDSNNLIICKELSLVLLMMRLWQSMKRLKERMMNLSWKRRRIRTFLKKK